MEKQFDVIILGAGPAGLTAGIYAARAGAKVLIIERAAAGGQINYAAELENYPGLDGVSGVELAEKMRAQAEKYGAEFLADEVIKIDAAKKFVTTSYSGEATCKAIIIASGTRARPLGLYNEQSYIGRGVSYCAVCDGGFFRKKVVAVAGGGNTAFKDALYLSNLCEKVYLIHRREGFRADKIYVERAKEKNNIEFVLNKTVTGLSGEGKLAAVEITDKLSGEKTELEVSGLFVALGALPDTDFLRGEVKLNENGYIITDENMQTSVKGVYAAGDIRQKSLRQIITAAADGAIAANSATDSF